MEEKKEKVKGLSDMQLMPDWSEEEQTEQDMEALAKMEKERKTIGKKMMKGME